MALFGAILWSVGRFRSIDRLQTEALETEGCTAGGGEGHQ